MQALDKYFDVLAEEARRDMSVFHTTWVVATVAPLLLYCVYAFLKWYVLLMPVTLPMTLWLTGVVHKSDARSYTNN